MLRNRFLLSILASTALVTAAGAADLGPSIAPPPVFTWTGVYVGANVGGSFSNSDRTRYTYTDPLECGNAACTAPSVTQLPFGSSSNNGGSVIGGAQVGYNWQMGSIVLGIEASVDIGGVKTRAGQASKENCELTGVTAGAACAASNTLIFGHDVFDNFLGSFADGGSFGTLRGRIGYSWDRALLFATGGLAWGGAQSAKLSDYRLQATPTATVAAPGVFYDGGEGMGVGFAVGGGLEYAVTPNWSLNAQYLYVDLYRHSGVQMLAGSGPIVGTILESSRSDSFSVVTLGLNYKFGAPATSAPVTSAY